MNDLNSLSYSCPIVFITTYFSFIETFLIFTTNLTGIQLYLILYIPNVINYHYANIRYVLYYIVHYAVLLFILVFSYRQRLHVIIFYHVWIQYYDFRKKKRYRDYSAFKRSVYHWMYFFSKLCKLVIFVFLVYKFVTRNIYHFCILSNVAQNLSVNNN